MTEFDDSNGVEEPFKVSLGIGQVSSFPGHEQSKVIGEDTYILRAFDGSNRAWDSYTLSATDKDLPEDHPDKRWWVVNVPDLGAHFFRAASSSGVNRSKLSFRADLSGYVEASSNGDSTMSGGNGFFRGALAVYEYGPGCLYVEEIVEGAARMSFIADRYEPSGSS